MRLQTSSLWRHPPGWAWFVVLAGLAFSQPVAAAPPALLPSTERSYSLPQAFRVPCFGGPLGCLGLANTSGTAKACHPVAIQPVVGAWYDTMYNKMQSWLGNQRHMIQFGCIGMVVALFIIWWRKT